MFKINKKKQHVKCENVKKKQNVNDRKTINGVVVF